LLPIDGALKKCFATALTRPSPALFWFFYAVKDGKLALSLIGGIVRGKGVSGFSKMTG